MQQRRVRKLKRGQDGQKETRAGGTANEAKEIGIKAIVRMYRAKTGGPNVCGGRRRSGKAMKREVATTLSRGGKNLQGIGCGQRICKARVEREWKAVGTAPSAITPHKALGREGGDGERKRRDLLVRRSKKQGGGQHQGLGS